MSTDLLSRLDEWARERKIWPRQFGCPYYQECQASLAEGAKLDGGKTCLMSYVARDYGEPVSGGPFRLVIVGIDHGWRGDKTEDFGGCQRGMEEVLYGGGQGKNFNPHYRGVIRTAAAVLGQSGRHCLGACYERKECAGDRCPQDARCVLRSFAQPNLVKCAPGPDMASKSTTTMLNRCARHLVSELEILRPDLLVFHGRPARWAFPWALQTEKCGTLAPLPESPTHDDFPVIQELTATGYKCPVLFLPHPSRGGLDRQWESVVEPALKLLRSKGAIPPL
jgi:Uracil DNA glycosylase superfamily